MALGCESGSIQTCQKRRSSTLSWRPSVREPLEEVLSNLPHSTQETCPVIGIPSSQRSTTNKRNFSSTSILPLPQSPAIGIKFVGHHASFSADQNPPPPMRREKGSSAIQISPPAPFTAFICLPHVDAKNKSAWVGRFLAVSNDVACDGRSTDESGPIRVIISGLQG